jgi:small-conductance mechanosensitive channel
MLDLLDHNFIDYKGFKVSFLSLAGLFGLWLLATVFLRLFRVFLHKNFLRRQLIDKAREFTIYSLIRYLVFILTFLVALGTLGVRLSWLFGAGIPLLVGIGLGLQSVFKDFVSGIVLLSEGIFKVGDVIEIDGMVAQVRKIDLRTTKVETGNGTYIIVPNSKLLDENVMNWSHNRKETRFSIQVTLAYGTDTATVRHLLFQCMSAHNAVSRLRKPAVLLTDFGENGLAFTLQFWSSEAWSIEQIKSDLRYSIENTLKQHGIIIPYPRRDLRMVVEDGIK